MFSLLKRKLERREKAITDEMLSEVFLRQKRVHLWFNVAFREKLRMFLSEYPFMIDEIELVEGKTPYFRSKQENYKNPSPAQAKVRLKVGEIAYGHYGEKGLRECKGIKMPLVCPYVQKELKGFEAAPKPRYSKKLRQRIEVKRKATWEETMKEFREALMQVADVVASK